MSEQRIDNFLFKRFKSLPKDLIYRSLRVGKIKINKKKILPSYKLKTNDYITIYSITINLKKKKIYLKKSTINLFLKNILFEDKYFIIFNKPCGLAVHGGSGVSFGVIEIFRNIRKDLLSLELVHRIDKETSGILILAKKRSILKKMHENLRKKNIYKEYIAVVKGYWSKKNTAITLPLLKKNNHNQKKKVCVHKNGKPAKTLFTVKKYFKNTTLLSIQPITGRTHQIRVHTSQFGHPIIFDSRYGEETLKNNLIIKKNYRLLLHAHKISFLHPKNNIKICIIAPLDKKFKNCLKYFKKNIY
ncbi:RluA family pseudouridine synthase [Buchnera aphidicola]|nr:RluA family pseudouridine synthase [Buchnera aphidicola]